MKTKKKRESMLEIYRGLPGEIYFLFIARAISCLGRFIAPVLALILTQKIGMDVGKAGVLVTSMIFLQAPCVLLGGKACRQYWQKEDNMYLFCVSSRDIYHMWNDAGVYGNGVSYDFGILFFGGSIFCL